eukprot:scaffold71585_cov49-Attheya_sp.AAC.4
MWSHHGVTATRSILGSSRQLGGTTVTLLRPGRIIPWCPTSIRLMASSSFSQDDLVVSILGPPNAGKSTLFNRLMCKEANRSYRLSIDKKSRGARNKSSTLSRRGSGGIEAIVSATPGTTRDRRECVGRIGGATFRLIDTAGVDGERIGHLTTGNRNTLEKSMMQQTLEAARVSDLVFLMLDARMGVTPDWHETARWLRTAATKHKLANVVVLANKLEGDNWTSSPVILQHLEEAARVGFGEPIPISAIHGDGLADVAVVVLNLAEERRQSFQLSHAGIITDDVIAAPQKDNDEDGEKQLQLAILGRQNVGKSTLVNALLKQERVIAGPMPGLTRDAISIDWTWKGRPVQLVDTAGIRKRLRPNDVHSKESTDIEEMAVRDAMRAMKVADVAVLVLDAEAGMLQKQELAIASAVVKEGRALVIAANKMDLLLDYGSDPTTRYTREEYAANVKEQVEVRFPMLRNTPVVAMSSLTGHCVQDLMPVVFEARDRWARIISTGILNRWLAEVVDAQAPPTFNGRTRVKIKYIMQTKGRPPTFLLFCNVPELPVSYLRYLTRNFQDTFQMYGMEVRFAIKKSATSNPYETKKKTKSSRGAGLGGRDARKKRIIQQLKTTGTVLKKGQRNRKPSNRNH